MSKPSKKKKRKPGRNAPCPCGSGKKFKKCCGMFINPVLPERLPEELRHKLEELQALEKQREQQQGLGRPIISLLHNGYRIVAVGNKLYWSKKWKTFHDFLFYYIKTVLGGEWGNAEIAKPFEERHPIIQWYHKVCLYQKETIKKPGEIFSVPMIGAVAAYLHLAYNLYLLAHNEKIQTKFIERLKNNRQFDGVYYETYVAAVFIKAGFDLEFENEDDGLTSHCEFTATSRKTQKKYSIEAKSRESGKAHAIISNQLYKALKKKADHKRVVFIDINIIDNAEKIGDIKWVKEALQSLRDKEESMTINGTLAPEAYIFVTNNSCCYNLESTKYNWTTLAEGFKIPDFKIDTGYASIRDVLRSREKHADMEQLIKSIKDHYEIPSTFDGEIPEFAFKKEMPRLKIGERYIIPSEDGTEVEGELINACVLELDKIAYGVYKLRDGKNLIVTSPLSEAELSAYKIYPDTFFGVYRRQCRDAKSPLDLFDFFYECYRNTPKERLLEFMREHNDYESLKKEPQEELAITYCERLVYSEVNKREKNSVNK